jgi:hypothetical protein
MKFYKIKKKEFRQPFRIKEVIAAPLKPKIPLIFIKKINKPSNFVEFVFEN